MTSNDKKYLAVMPTLKTKRVDMLLEDVIGCRWTISVLRAVASGIRRPGALERHITGISNKVLNDRLRHLTRAGIFDRTRSIPCSSFRHGIITVIDCPLYISAESLA